MSMFGIKFKDKNHNHIVTGNFEIVENAKLKTLLKQGPQFREQPQNTNFKGLERNLKHQINKFIEYWASTSGAPIEAFAE